MSTNCLVVNCITISLSVYTRMQVHLCLLTYLKKPHVQTEQKIFCYLWSRLGLPLTTVDGARCILPVLWMTSRFDITGHNSDINIHLESQ